MEKTVYLYARISSNRQNIERQIRNLREVYPQGILIEEVYTGTKFQERKKLMNLLKIVKEGDTIVFDSVSRMSRNAEEGVNLYMELFNRGINLIFLKEAYINTLVYRSKLENINIPNIENKVLEPLLEGLRGTLILLAKEQIEIAFEQSEKEVMDLRQRTKEGLITAKLNGKQVGNIKGVKLTTKKSIEAKELIQKYSKEFKGTLNDSECMKLIGISRNTFYKYKKEIKEA